MREPDDDRDLMLRYAAGDSSAFEQLYGRHKAPLYRYLLRQCAQPATAEEIFQEVWIKVIGARDAYRPDAKFTTWLYRIAHNAFIDFVRRQRVRPAGAMTAIEPDQLGSEQPGPERSAASTEAGQRLLAALSALPDEQREAFLLREEGGLSLAEIGEITGVGRETVKSRLRYALAKLRAALGEHHDD